ncbi:MAG: NAD(P)-binding domain-containing protein [Verrucomicrobia bacterium]|nr:NAD(P)-binding domain-containing protein [Verrucomicrobiota bacterium]
MRSIRRYAHWLHTQWPAGTVEKLPEVNEDGSTNVAGVYAVGDLTGIPLLKFSSDTGARVVDTIVADPAFAKRSSSQDVYDIVIIGAGVSGMAAALAARQAGLRFILLEAAEPFSTIVNFPKGKPIYTYPTDMTPRGELQFSDEASVKEVLVDELRSRTIGRGIAPVSKRAEKISRKGDILEVHAADGDAIPAHRVIVGIGRSGNFRKLDVPGEELDKVYNRLHDPKDFCETKALVVGGGDSALETAIALAQCGADVTLSYRKPEFSRAKPDNVAMVEQLALNPNARVAIEHPTSERVTTATGDFVHPKHAGSLRLEMSSNVKAIRENEVDLATADGDIESLDNDVIFTMLGREAPLDFFRRSGIRIRGEWRRSTWVSFVLFFVFCIFMYHWKSGGLAVNTFFQKHGLFPFNFSGGDPTTLSGTIRNAIKDPGFYYSLVYCLCVAGFGIRRIQRRRTPYVKSQTLALTAIQIIPLFILPYVLIPWMGNNGVFDTGIGKWFGDTFFPGQSYWRSFGFILAWPLFIWNVFTEQPVWGWLVLSLIQTFVIIPLIVRRWGKGAYCGWICSCGALAETMGDAHRHKMPHGPFWNRMNLVGQVVLLFAFILLILRIITWVSPGSALSHIYEGLLSRFYIVNYKYLVDLWLAGILGVGVYFHFSGRVWCRFACPLAALMHIYARFSQFRILADKKKCISCNVCTSVCHQGIDVMNFANKGLPMADPECVRCSACVQSCPTGVLTFGRIDTRTGKVIGLDRLPSSPVRMKETGSTMGQ